jgi:hypothetical protein
MAGDWLPPQAPGDPPPPPTEPPRAPAAAPSPAPLPPPGYPPPQYPQSGFPPPAYRPSGYIPQPPNNDAVVGFTCAVIGAALLFFTAGLSTIVSLVLGIVAIPYARRGKRVIAEGRTQKHKDLANAGYVLGIVTVVLSVLAIVAWVLLITLVDWDEIDDGDDDPFDQDFQDQVVLRVLAAAVRLVC